MRRPARWVGAAGALLLALALAGTPAEVAPAASIPVHDVFTIIVTGPDGGQGRFEGAVHAAYGVPGGTVLYGSLREAEGSDVGLAAALAPDADGLPRLVGGVLADPETATVTPALVVDDRCLCTVAEDLEGVDGHAFATMYTVFPPLSSPTIDVDVDGAGTVVIGVPVLRGHAEPLVPAPVVPMGAGWPSFPREEVLREALGGAAGAGHEPETAQDMVGRSESKDGNVRVEESAGARLVSIQADVLFAWDEAEITDRARATLLGAAEEIGDLGAEEVVVTGHTDSTGDVARNDELSLERAEAVRDLLADVLPDVRIRAEGRGQWEPVASNDDPDGRAQNRRATIAYVGAGGTR